MDFDSADDFRAYARFENKDEFVSLRDQILAFDLHGEQTEEQKNAEGQVFQKISTIVSDVLK